MRDAAVAGVQSRLAASVSERQNPPMKGEVDSPRQPWWLLLLTLFTFFVLLGSRSLNEPDEGRYAEIAREMIELGDWLVPHFWYVPHLDKPPLTYWFVALSLSVFGQNEWAVRLPLALAGISGVWASYLFGNALGGRRAGIWSALILQSSLLYFVMARMLTTDIFLTQFIAWAVYLFWQSGRCLDDAEAASASRRSSRKRFFAWHLAGWTAVALGFLTKGPIAFLVPLACVGALLVYRRGDGQRMKTLLGGLLAGLALLVILILPWFCVVFHRVPHSFDFMVFGQVVGHALGTTIKNRRGSPFYFFAIVAVGFLPWTWLLGWLWRRAHWRGLNDQQREAWVLLSVWTLFPFVLFSLTRSKLPAYILPIFPALAVLIAVRYFNIEPAGGNVRAPDWAWRLGLISPLLLLAAAPLILIFVFHVDLPAWMKLQVAIAAAGAAVLTGLCRARHFERTRYAGVATGLGLVALLVTAAEMRLFETSFKANQTLKPLGLALRENFVSGDQLVCWGRLPQGLPFYAQPAISATHRPQLGGMPLSQVPFELPGNRERFGDLLLPDEAALGRLLAGEQRVLVVGFAGTFDHFQSLRPDHSLRFVRRVGQWELFANH